MPLPEGINTKQLRHTAGQVVGPAHMSAEEGHHEPPGLVQAQYCRIGELVPHIGGNGPDSDAHRAHKYQPVIIGKVFFRPVRQGIGFPAAHHALT